jgi:hypothetical protein
VALNTITLTLILLQIADICRAKNIFVLTLDEIFENNIALAVFIGKSFNLVEYKLQIPNIYKKNYLKNQN